MDIPTFGALLRFAAELEEEHQEAYEKAAEVVASAATKEALLELAQQNQKSQSLVERLYRDSIRSDMDIGFQEPIQGMNRADYLDEGAILPSGADIKAFVAASLKLEKNAKKFYQEASLQTKGHWGSVSRSMDKIVKEKEERIAKLQSLAN
jgi:rubrerythrin